MPSVLLFGAGAIGIAYLHVLNQAKASITAVCRSNYDAAKSSGFTINSTKWGLGLHVKPAVVRSVSEVTEAFDFILVVSKAFPGSTPSTAELIAPAVGPKTVIALLQNGIGCEEEYRVAFPNNPILSCVVYLPSTQVRPGVIEMGGIEELQIGVYPSDAPQEPAHALAELLKAGGSNSIVFEDIQPKKWSKLLVNASWNPTCALSRSSDRDFLRASEGSESFVYSVMLEVVAIAQTLGYSEINEKEARRQLDRATIRTKGVEPSMLADVREGRSMEVEAIVGNAVRIAREHGVSVPRLETLYYLAKALNGAIEQERSEEN